MYKYMYPYIEGQTIQWPKKKDKQFLQNITQKTNDRAPQTLLKTGCSQKGLQYLLHMQYMLILSTIIYISYVQWCIWNS